MTRYSYDSIWRALVHHSSKGRIIATKHEDTKRFVVTIPGLTTHVLSQPEAYGLALGLRAAEIHHGG